MTDVKPILKSLGLLDSEIKTYMAAFKNGPSTVLELTKSTGLSRQASYVAIETLTDRGLMTSFLRGKKRFYASEHPDRLLTYARSKQDEMREMVSDLKRSLPQLELQMGGERPKVRAFEGREGVRAIFEDLTKSKPKEIYEIVDSHAFEQTVDEKEVDLVKEQLNKTKPQVMGIYTEVGDKLAGGEQSKRITLDKKDWGFQSDVLVYGNKTALISLKGKQHSVIVESKEIADGLRKLFELAIK